MRTLIVVLILVGGLALLNTPTANAGCSKARCFAAVGRKVVAPLRKGKKAVGAVKKVRLRYVLPRSWSRNR